MPQLLAVRDAARELGVNASRVRELIAANELAAEKIGGRWLIDAAAIAARKRVPTAPGRPLSPRNAWLLLLAASHKQLPPELDSVSRWRVGKSLEHVGLVGLRGRLEGRGRAHGFHALPGELRALRARGEIVLSGSSAAGAHNLELLAPDALDAYIPLSQLGSLASNHALDPAPPPNANVVLRAVPDDAWLLADQRVAPLAAVALDLAAYPDPRSSRVGEALLRRLDDERHQSA